MPWLVVLGGGDWLPERGVRLSPGKHLVDDLTAERARRSGLTRLVVLDAEPEIEWPDHSGPLSLENVKRGTPRGPRLVVERPPDAPVLVDDGPPSEYPCLHCDVSRRTQAALDRHIEFHHSDS